MKIIHLVLTPRLSGAEILAVGLSIKQSASGNSVVIIALNPIEESFVPFTNLLCKNNIRTIFPETRLRYLSRLRWIRKIAFQEEAAIIFAHTIIPSAYARFSFLFSFRVRPKIVSVLNDASQDDYKSRLFRYPERFVLPAPAAVIAVSEEAKQNYSKRIRFSRTVDVIPNGVPLKEILRWREHRETIRKEIFEVVNNEAIVILQIGRFSPVKQQRETIQAAKEASYISPKKIKLYFVGITEDPDYEVRTREYAASLVGGNLDIAFLGPRTDTYRLLAGIDIFVMPSRAEAFSVAYLEALASGAPVIASNISAFNFSHVYPGVYIYNLESVSDYKDTICNVIANPMKYHQRDLLTYDIEHTAKAYDRVTARITRQ